MRVNEIHSPVPPLKVLSFVYSLVPRLLGRRKTRPGYEAILCIAAGACSQHLLSSHAGSGLTKESSVHLREVHFVRLLSLVLQNLDQTDTPPSLLSYVHLKEIVHPF